MKARWVTALPCLVIVGLLLQPLPGADPGASAQSNRPAAPLAPRTMVINELAPIPANGGYEWVELVNIGGGTAVYLPLVLRNYRPGAASMNGRSLSTDAVVAPLGGGLDISGWQISDEDGNTYTIPAALGPVPPGAYVLILFDGQGSGSDDYDLSDGAATLHSPAGLVDIFEDTADQVALYTGGAHNALTLHDFVAYGAFPGADGGNADKANLWSPELYVADTEPIPGAKVLAPGGSLGLLPGHEIGIHDPRGLYLPGETTPGEENGVPAPELRTPAEDVETTDRRIPFGWTTVADAVNYQFQLARDAGFGSPVVDEVLTGTVFVPASDLPDGTYHYRVRARLPGGAPTNYSPSGQVTIITPAASSKPEEEYWLNVEPLLQHKDSRMICVDGHDRSGSDSWDSAHENGKGDPVRVGDHDDNYCTRAAIAMIVSHHETREGAWLSQDRLSYYHFGGDLPHGDLGHGQGMRPDYVCTDKKGTPGKDDVLTWAMGGGKIDCGKDGPGFDKIKGWIDADRPVLLVTKRSKDSVSAHAVVVDGYKTAGEMVRRIDPLTATANWVKYSSLHIDAYLCPVGDKTPRRNEDDFSLDTDLDGLTNFDEKKRLKSDERYADSDNDWQPDKWDLWEWHHPTYPSPAQRPWRYVVGADMDNDGLRKEEDWDNDGGGALDGCEDANQNGEYDAGETYNFNASDDVPCIPTVLEAYTTDYSENLKTSFRPGEAIVLVIKAKNHQAEDKTVKFTWDTRDPSDKSVGYLSLADYTDTLQQGTDTIWIDGGIAKNATAGSYSYRGSLVHRGRTRSKSTTLSVAGEAISIGLARALSCRDVEDNLFVDETDTFTPTVEKAVVWTAWEGAWGTHKVKYAWYLPGGTHYFDYEHTFNTGEALYKSWSWIEGVGLYKTGEWQVKVYLDGAYVETVEFRVAAGGQAMPSAPPQGTAVDGGGGTAPP